MPLPAAPLTLSYWPASGDAVLYDKTCGDVLRKLVALYDDNHIQLDGPTAMAWSEDVVARFEAYGWQVLTVADGNDLDAVEQTLKRQAHQIGTLILEPVNFNCAGLPNSFPALDVMKVNFIGLRHLTEQVFVGAEVLHRNLETGGLPGVPENDVEYSFTSLAVRLGMKF